MLDDYKNQCKASADLVLKDWQQLTKNDLCKAYIQNEEDSVLSNAYFSALLYKYWNLIPKFYVQSSNVAEPEDVYNWLVDSISYALKHRRWTQEDSSIYKDSTGPDKVINRRMKCARLTYYQFLNRKKRKQDFDLLSLDELKEDYQDNLDISDVEHDLTNTNIDLKEYIINTFNNKDYFLAFLLTILSTEDVFENGTFSYKKTIKHFKRIDASYCIAFAHYYDIDVEAVLNTLKYFQKRSTLYLKHKIEYYLCLLSHNKSFKEVLNVN